MTLNFPIFYPWQAESGISVSTPWGVVVRATMDQKRHPRGSSEGGQFAAEQVPYDPEIPQVVTTIQGKFKEYNRARVKLAKAKKQARDEYGPDHKWPPEVEGKVADLYRDMYFAKESFNSQQRVGIKYGVRVNALGKWTNKDLDPRLMNKSVDAMLEIKSLKAEMVKAQRDHPDILAAEKEKREATFRKLELKRPYDDFLARMEEKGHNLDTYDSWERADMLKWMEVSGDYTQAEIDITIARRKVWSIQKRIKDEFTEKARAVVAVDDPIEIRYRFGQGARTSEILDRDKIRNGVDAVMGLVSRDLHLDEDGNPAFVQTKFHDVTKEQKKRRAAGHPGRSYCRKNEVYLIEGDVERRVITHELGHVIEHGSRGVQYKANQFLKRRTQGQKPRPLRDITGIQAYAEHEVAIKDGFANAYTGKIYAQDENGNPRYVTSTEVISMGIEYMAMDPVQFAEDDPDYFSFVYTVLRGG